MIVYIGVYSYTLFACVIYAVMIIINRNIKTLALIFCRKYVANFVVNMKNVVFIYMNNASKYTITNKIRFNLKEIEKLKSSFWKSYSARSGLNILVRKRVIFYNPLRARATRRGRSILKTSMTDTAN